MLRNIICVEESHLLTRASPDRSDLSEPILSTMAREARKFGFSLWLVDQVPSLIPASILANMNTRFTLKLLSGADIRSVGDSMALSPDEREFLTELESQVCIMRCAAFPKAFVVRIPDIERADISESDIEAATERSLASLSWKERCQRPEEEKAPELPEDVVPKDEQDYMIFIANHPELTATVRDRRFAISTWKGNALRGRLVKRGFIKTFVFATGRKGGQITMVVITTKGYEYLEMIKARVKPLAGVGGPLHRIGQIWIKQSYERHYPGCEATIEEQVDGSNRRVDVEVRLGNRRVAVELLVEGVDKEMVNISKVLASGSYQELVLVTTDEDSLTRLREVAKKVIADMGVGETAVSFRLLGEFLPEKLS